MLKQLTTRKVSEFGVFSGMYFPVFGLNMVINIVRLRIQYKYEKSTKKVQAIQASLTEPWTTLEQKDFLNNGPHFEFHSRSFNYSIPNKGNNGVIGERNSM